MDSDVRRLRCFTVGVTATAPGVLQGPILDGLAEALDRRPAVRRHALGALERGDVAAVFTRDPAPGPARTVPLHHEGRVAVLAADHPLAHRAQVVLAELARDTVLLMEGGSADEDFLDLRERWANGAGVGIAPASAARLHPDARLRLVPNTDVAPSRVALARGTARTSRASGRSRTCPAASSRRRHGGAQVRGTSWSLRAPIEANPRRGTRGGARG